MNAITPFEARAKDPATIGYPPTLPIEIALKTATLPELKLEYGFSDEDWSALPTNPYFIADLQAAAEMVKKEGMSFKLKARLQAEELLKQSWILIHSAETPHSVRSDLIKSTMRWAGYDNKEAAAGSTGVAFQINIDLS